jgi:hypothetical protein
MIKEQVESRKNEWSEQIRTFTEPLPTIFHQYSHVDASKKADGSTPSTSPTMAGKYDISHVLFLCSTFEDAQTEMEAHITKLKETKEEHEAQISDLTQENNDLTAKLKASQISLTD